MTRCSISKINSTLQIVLSVVLIFIIFILSSKVAVLNFYFKAIKKHNEFYQCLYVGMTEKDLYFSLGKPFETYSSDKEIKEKSLKPMTSNQIRILVYESVSGGYITIANIYINTEGRVDKIVYTWT